jgi:hypothetical protein
MSPTSMGSNPSPYANRRLYEKLETIIENIKNTLNAQRNQRVVKKLKLNSKVRGVIGEALGLTKIYEPFPGSMIQVATIANDTSHRAVF